MENNRQRRVLIPAFSERIRLAYYIRSIERQNMTAVVVEDADHVSADMAEGLLLPGGVDINPAQYGEEMNGAGAPDDALDRLQLAWLHAFVQAGRPVLGICRGHQLVNVYFGGTLVEDLTDRWKHAKHNLSEPDKYHDVRIVGSESWLRALYGNTFHVNSSHHEAVDRLGEGLVIDLASLVPEDPQIVVEGMHHKNLPIWTVQFHPERCLPWSPEFPEPGLIDGDAVFAFFAKQVQQV